MSRPAAPRHHEAPEVATGVPDVADGEEADDEEDEDDEDDEDEDEERLAGVVAVELAAPAVAALRCAEAGRATAIAAAAAALSTPAPAVTAASLVLPRRLFRLALASSASGDPWPSSASGDPWRSAASADPWPSSASPDSCSVVMGASRFVAQIGSYLIQARRAGSIPRAGRLGGCYEISPRSDRQRNSRRNPELNPSRRELQASAP